jgi:hypothetical protein
MMQCPQCGHAQPSSVECVRCGIVFEKFYAIQKRKQNPHLGKSALREAPGAENPQALTEKPRGRVASLVQQYFWKPYRSPWNPMGKEMVIALICLFGYIVYALAREGQYDLYPDAASPMTYLPAILFKEVNLVFHEAGHWIFAIFGNRSIEVLGGSLNQVLIPLIVTSAFWQRRDASGFAFGLVWASINLLEVGIYMADARHPVLPLIGDGDPYVGHDWRNLFNAWNLWTVDTAIAKTTYRLGWMVLGGSILWYGWIGFQPKEARECEKSPD